MKNLKRFSVVCDLPAAEPTVRAVVKMPESPETRFDQAHALATQGRHLEAVVKYRELSDSIAKFPWLPLNLGTSLVALGKWDEAVEAFEWATRSMPENFLAYGNLGAALGYLGRSEEALPHLCQAVKLAPDDLNSLLNLVRAMHALRHPDTIKVAHMATKLAPGTAESWLSYGDALLLFGASEDAYRSYSNAEKLNPGCLNRSNNYGLSLFRTRRHQEAIEFFEGIVELRPQDSDALAELGVAQLHGGNIPEAVNNLRRSTELNPTNEFIHSNLLLSMCYSSDYSATKMLEEAKGWGARYAPEGKTLPALPVHRHAKLRIGYLSADFHAHPAGYLYEAMFPFHDRSRFEIFAYSTEEWFDDVTRKIQSSVDRWTLVKHETDEELAARIRDDEIDILIDLLGHTPGHRLKVFGRHPAPIQATWLGYFGTTGMSQMDYIISDRYVLPEEHEPFYTERAARMPECLYVFQAPKLQIAPNSLPALTNGYITFGCFNNLAKLTPDTVALWCEVLRALPTSRMILNRWPLDSEKTRERYAALFAEQGIDLSRIDFRATKERAEYLQSYHQVDIMLDTLPFGGGTTTSEALWMGVPVVSLSTDRFPGRMSESILRTVGLAELIPTDRADFVRLALDLSRDLSRLSGLRETLRGQLEGSPLCDVPNYTRQLESTFEWMWADKFGNAGI